MGASKKQRGKQRKAAKSKAAERDGILAVSQSPTKLISLIQRGDNAATAMYCSGDYTLSRVQNETVVTSVLGFLQRCESETFDSVIADIGGDLETPLTWIDSMLCAIRSNSSFVSIIAKNIGHLMRCMCDDMNKLFFQSNQHWKESFKPFVQLIWFIIYETFETDILDCSAEKEEVIKTLLHHENENFLASIVQWSSFWNRSNRPDIELGFDSRKMIYNCGRLSTHLLVKNVVDLRKTIATMPIISREYDPSCTVSYVAGIVDYMMYNECQKEDFETLHHLVVDTDCVDQSVIEGMVNLGFKLSADLERSILLMNISREMIVQKEQPSDTRVAFAIRAGLVEMCLTFVGRFGRQTTNENDIQTALLCHIEGIFKSIYDVALHKKTWKAIRHQRQVIEARSNHLDFITHDNCKKLVLMVKSILDMNGAYCCHCNKSLGRKERFQCGECNRMTYCSRSCQRSDWLNGHSHACCKTYNDDNCGQFQGRAVPPTIPEDERTASKLGELEINNNMIQLKLFLDHSATILEQAKSLNIPLYDCIVKFELRYCPLKVTTHHYTELYDDESVGKKQYEASRSEKNITCMFSSHNFIGGMTNHLGKSAVLGMQRLFPCEWLTDKK